MVFKTDAKIRAKNAPDKVTNAKAALNAFRHMNTYRDMARDALATANKYSGGVHTRDRHLDRAAQYDDVADDWENVLGQWLRAQAGEGESQ